MNEQSRWQLSGESVLGVRVVPLCGHLGASCVHSQLANADHGVPFPDEERELRRLQHVAEGRALRQRVAALYAGSVAVPTIAAAEA
ncbi:MAG TPA: hypothetical protein VLH84_05110 [Patescibacteria group bacterium]|nr:hypothetical protein [Patescibacteria group bacterium]